MNTNFKQDILLPTLKAKESRLHTQDLVENCHYSEDMFCRRHAHHTKPLCSYIKSLALIQEQIAIKNALCSNSSLHIPFSHQKALFQSSLVRFFAIFKAKCWQKAVCISSRALEISFACFLLVSLFQCALRGNFLRSQCVLRISVMIIPKFWRGFQTLS